MRRVYEAATDRGWTGPAAQARFGASWPVPSLSVDQIERLAGPPDYAYGSVWHSLTGMGDFGRYILQPALRDVVSDDEQTLKQDAERAIFDRVVELGWTPERFDDFDGGCSGGRDSVVERVGKKYQWIGFYEVLGRIADNLPVQRFWEDHQPQPYQYAEQLVWRDIDPTVLVQEVAGHSRPRPIWFASSIASFPEGLTDQYPSDMAGVPDPLDLLTVTDTEGDEWVVLVANHSWEQPIPPEVAALETPAIQIWMQLHAYLVPTAELATLTEWAQGQDWFGGWMPEIAEAFNVLLGSHPYDPEWVAADGIVNWLDARAGGAQPVDLRQCGARYAGTGTSRDASSEEESRGFVPTRPLMDALRLSAGVDFRWCDSSGLAVYDPSVLLGGPPTFVMRRDLIPLLHQSGYALFWTVLVGNELRHRGHMPPREDYRWVSASASYIMVGERIERVHALASRCRPGPTTEYSIEWATRSAE